MTSSPTVASQDSNQAASAGPSGSRGSSQSSKGDFTERMLYEAMAGAVISSIEEFLQPFQSAPDSTFVFKSMTREDFFSKFVRAANKLTDDCCQKLVRIIRSSSRLPVVRESSTPELAKRIRETAFKQLDAVLAGYYGIAKKIHAVFENIKKIREELERRGGAEGSLAKTEKAAGDSRAEGSNRKEWGTEGELARQQQTLLQIQSQAYSRMAQYLRGLNELSAALLAYACDKCFAGEVNYPLELEQVDAIRAEIQLKLANALQTFARVGAVAKQDVEQERANIISNFQLEKAHQALEKMWEEKLKLKLKGEARFKRFAIAASIAIILSGIAFAVYVALHL